MESQQEEVNNNKKRKKTRDLPDLSECHSCGFRVDSFTGKNTLQILYSEWRIVILCKICFVRVESSQLCSYCFKNSSDNCFNCRQCKRIIHQSCFFNHATFSSSSQFSVCVDCWIPKSIAAKRACFRPTKRKNSALLDFGDCRNKLLGDVVRDASCVVQGKVVAAARARELAVEKALAARRATELARNALECAGGSIDDIKLALRLHRVMNSSPRILKNLCLVSSCCLDVPNPWVKAGACRKLEVSYSKTVSDPSVCVGVSGYDSSINMASFGSDGIDEVWIRPNAKDSNVEEPLNVGERSSYNKLMNSEFQSCREREAHGPMKPADERYNGKPGGYMIKYTRRTPAYERCYGKPGRYLIKYSRRTPANEKYAEKYDVKHDRYLIKYSRRTPANEIYDGKCNRDLIKYARRTPADKRYNGKRDRYLIKYIRRKFNQRSIQGSRSCCLYDGVITQVSAIGLMLSCSKESMAFSRASLQTCPFATQGSACSSDLSGGQS